MCRPFQWHEHNCGSFQLFGVPHLVTLGILALGVLTIIILRRRFSFRAGRVLRYSLAGLLLVNEVSTHIWHSIVGVWTIQSMLPLHLCSVFIWLTMVMLVTRSYRIYEFAYFLGIGGALQALVTPNHGFGFPHYRFMQSFFAHAPIVWAAVYMTTAEGYRPTGKSLLRVAVGTNLYMFVIYWVNVFIGSNYLFINDKPGAPSMLDILGPWPWYILGMEVVGAVICLILYAPFAIRDWRHRKVTPEASGQETGD